MRRTAGRKTKRNLNPFASPHAFFHTAPTLSLSLSVCTINLCVVTSSPVFICHVPLIWHSPPLSTDWWQATKLHSKSQEAINRKETLRLKLGMKNATDEKKRNKARRGFRMREEYAHQLSKATAAEHSLISPPHSSIALRRFQRHVSLTTRTARGQSRPG